MNSAKSGKISPTSIFYIFFVSRVIVSLTYVQSVSTGVLKADILISIALALPLTVLLSIPVIFCIKTGKNPLCSKAISLIYGIYFSVLAGINVSRFSYFSSSQLNPTSQGWIFALLIIVCAVYAAYLGIEGISRFSAFGFILLLLGIGGILVFNIDNLEMLNFYPVIYNSTGSILSNALLLTSNSIEMVIYLSISQKVNGNAQRQFLWAIVASFVCIFLLLLFVIGVLGDGASLQSFPVYILSQVAGTKNYERIDVFYTAFWICAIFIKASVLIYCASVSVKKLRHGTKCVLFGVVSFAIAAVINETGMLMNASRLTTILPFILFGFIIPVAFLIFCRKTKGDELLESF